MIFHVAKVGRNTYRKLDRSQLWQFVSSFHQGSNPTASEAEPHVSYSISCRRNHLVIPEIGRCFHFETQLPGNHQLKILKRTIRYFKYWYVKNFTKVSGTAFTRIVRQAIEWRTTNSQSSNVSTSISVQNDKVTLSTSSCQSSTTWMPCQRYALISHLQKIIKLL